VQCIEPKANKLSTQTSPALNMKLNLAIGLLAFGITPSLAAVMERALPGPGHACYPFTTTKYNWSGKCGTPGSCGVYGTKVCNP